MIYDANHKDNIIQIKLTLRIFPGGRKNTLFCSVDATDECKGITQSEDGPPNWYDAANLSYRWFISDTP